MRQAGVLIICGAVMLSLSAPLRAQEPAPDLRRGLEMLGEGARAALEGLMDDIGPLLEDDVLAMLGRLGALVDDLSQYQMPERLPNGDILIRRAPNAPPLDDPGPGKGLQGDVEI